MLNIKLIVNHWPMIVIRVLNGSRTKQRKMVNHLISNTYQCRRKGGTQEEKRCVSWSCAVSHLAHKMFTIRNRAVSLQSCPTDLPCSIGSGNSSIGLCLFTHPFTPTIPWFDIIFIPPPTHILIYFPIIRLWQGVYTFSPHVFGRLSRSWVQTTEACCCNFN